MKSNTLRRLHRWLGLLFSLSVLMSSLSGVIHTIMARTQAPPPSVRPSGSVSPLQILVGVPEVLSQIPRESGTVSGVNLRSIGGEPWYQIYLSKGGSPLYSSAVDGHQDAARDEVYASEIASAFLGGARVRKTDYLSAFNDEYINIFRVLPVYRFDTDDGLGTRVYVSTTTGTVTRHTDNRRQWEADLFSNLHKFKFIADRQVRDVVLVGVTLGTALAAIAGIGLFFVTAPRRGKKSV